MGEATDLSEGSALARAFAASRAWGDLSGELGRALNRAEFRVHYQPTVDLRDGSVVGVEALLRWQHPEWGELEPEGFLPQAERSPIVVPLGCWVIEQAVERAAHWRRVLGRPLRVWVNLAASQLEAVSVITTVLTGALERFGAEPDLIGFEVTESTLMRSIDDAVVAIRSLRELGVDIALDDFGTGYSSLAYLRRLPVSTVKIDRSFVAGMGGSLADAAIVEAVIDLAHALGHGVLAEGVEELGQAEELLALGAERAQGFYFSPPLPADDVERLLDLPWCGAKGPEVSPVAVDHRADRLPGAGGPRARLLLTALDSVSDAVVVFAAAPNPRRSRIVYVNPAFEAQTGLLWADVVGSERDVLNQAGPEHPEVAREVEAMTAGSGITVELPARRADGTTYPCEVTLSPVVDDKGIVTHWLALRRDLTSRRRLEADRERFQRIIERGSAGAVLSDLRGRITYANRAAGELSGATVDDLLRTNVRNLYDPPLDEWAEANVLESAMTQGAWIGTHTVRNRATGELVPVEVEVQLVTEHLEASGDVYLATLLHDRRPELRRQDLREVAGRFASRVLERPPRQSLEELRTLVRDVGDRFSADRCFVDVIDVRRQVIVTEACWEDGRTKQGRLEVPVEKVTVWLDLLARDDLVLLDGSETELAAGHEQRMQAFEVGSPLAQIAVPMRVDGQLLGVVGVSMAPGVVRAWSDDEIDFMRSLGETTANLVARHRVEEIEARRATHDQLAFAVAQRALDLGPADFLDSVAESLAEIGRVLESNHVVAGRLVGEKFVELGSWTTPDIGPAGATGQQWPDAVDLAVAAKTAGPSPLILPALGELGASPLDVIGSTIVVPLVVAGRSIGVLAVRTQQRRSWTDDEVAVVRAVGETIAFALERRRVDEALARSEARLSGLLANTADIVVVIDRQGLIRYASPAIADLMGSDPIRVVGRRFTNFVHPGERATARQGLERADGVSQTERLRLRHSDGTYRWFEARTNDRFDDEVGGLVVVLRNIDDRVAAERAAATRTELEQFTLRVSRFDLESSEGFVIALDNVLAEFGALLGVHFAFVDLIDDAAGLLRNHAVWALPTCVSTHDVFPLSLDEVPTWRARLGDLTPLVISDVERDGPEGLRADLFRLGPKRAFLAIPLASEGEPIGVLGVGTVDTRRAWTADEVRTTSLIADLTASAIAKARVDAALRASETRFRLLAEHAADVVLLAGPDGELRYLSPSIRELLGHEPEDLLGARLIDLAHADDHETLRRAMEELAVGEVVTHEVRLVRRDGSWIWVANTSRAVRGVDGQLIEVRGSLRDVSERKRLEAELAERATHDPLTGLGNRALLAEWLERLADLTELCVLLIDLDGFKAVNDDHGHSTGDQVLKIVAARLRQVTRPGELIVRYGGDEFIVVSDQINAAGAIALGDRMVAAVSRPIALHGLMIVLGASIGVAVADGAGIASDRLLRAADSAMYRAKREGKGTVRLAAVRA